jgi:predicted RND superfamily exporter protein
VVICILGILPSVFFTLVCFSFFDAKVNLITLLAIPIVIVLSIADIVHLITGFYSPTYHQEEKSVKIIQSLKAYLLPSFLTSLTTCLAFYSLALSQSEHIQKLGLIAGTAIIGSFFFTYLFIPILLRWLPNKKLKDHGVTKLSKHFSSNRKLYAAAMTLCFLSSLFFVSDVEFKSDFENFFPKNSPMGKNYKELNTHYSSQAKLNILIEKKDEKASSTLANTVDEVAALANGEENVLQLTYARSASKNRIMGISPFSLQSLTQKYDLKKNFISEDAATERIELRFSSPEEIKNFEDKMSDQIHKLTEGYQVDYASSSLVMEAVDKNIASALIKSLLASTLLIIVVILFLTRSIPQTFFSLLANLAPLSAIILVLGLFDLKLNVLTAITSVVCLGLIVDDTIHVLYRKVRLKSDLHELGIGMLSTSILLTGGFLSLNLSYFVPTQTFGNISSVVFVITLVSDLTLLPLLLDSYRKKKDFT